TRSQNGTTPSAPAPPEKRELFLRGPLVDGRRISVPLAWFPRLLHASVQQRNEFELIGDGEGIHWPAVDEDISVRGLVLGYPSVEYRKGA
ncbi:MAG: DUF2442 domain-containing protein, partial [Anaerolineales bacterium]